MIARVVAKRDETRLALGATAAAALGLGAVLVDDLAHVHLLGGPEPFVYLLVTLAMVLGAIGPWLAWSRRGAATTVRCEPGVVWAGGIRINAADVTALSIAHGARGRSVAIARGPKSVVFLEVERAEDATRICEALSVPAPFGKVMLPIASRALAFLQGLFTLVALACGPLYFLAATHGYSVLAHDGKALFGVGGVAMTELAMLLLLGRRLARGQAVAVMRGAWDAHVALHRAGAAKEDEGPPTEAEHVDAHGDAEAPPRVGNLGRGDERVGAWLARLDSIPTEQHAYRGDAMKKDVLWETLGDGAASVDTRMAAARVLRRRYGEAPRELVRVVEDPDVRVRVEAALEEPEEAEERIESLGPLFRAR